MVTRAFISVRLALYLVIALFLIVPDAPAQSDQRVIRALDAALAATLDDAYRSSPVMRSLADELERSDLIVHIVALPPPLRPHFLGMMHFVQVAGGRRFLRLSVNERLGSDQRAAALGHELYHAVEVARARAVVGQASLGVLYRTIGEARPTGRPLECYETEQAIRAGEAVLAEVREDQRRRTKLARRARGAAASLDRR